MATPSKATIVKKLKADDKKRKQLQAAKKQRQQASLKKIRNSKPKKGGK